MSQSRATSNHQIGINMRLVQSKKPLFRVTESPLSGILLVGPLAWKELPHVVTDGTLLQLVKLNSILVNLRQLHQGSVRVRDLVRHQPQAGLAWLQLQWEWAWKLLHLVQADLELPQWVEKKEANGTKDQDRHLWDKGLCRLQFRGCTQWWPPLREVLSYQYLTGRETSMTEIDTILTKNWTKFFLLKDMR